MSETNPPPVVVPPANPPAPAPASPAPAPTPTPEPAPSATPNTDLLTRLETVLQGLPERTANAVREVSPQHVPNPTANPQNPAQSAPNQPPPPPGNNPSGKTSGGPSRFAKWWHGMS